MQTQLIIDLTKPHAPPFPGAGMGDTTSERAAMLIRTQMTFNEMCVERQAITAVGMHRYEVGDRAGLGGPRGHQGCGTAFSVLDWLTDAECERFNYLGLALPTNGEEQQAAMERIQERLSARKAPQEPKPKSRPQLAPGRM